MKRKFAKFIAIATAATLLGASLSGCSPKEQAAPDTSNGQGTTDSAQAPKEMTVWLKKAMTEEGNKMLAERAQAFATANNVKVNVEIFAYEDAMTKYSAAIESGNVPDMTFIGYQEAGQFNAQGLLMDLSDLYAEMDAANPFVPSMKKAITHDGKQVAIPNYASSQVLIYRKDMLQAAGYAAPPATWEEFRTAAIEMTDAANGIYGAGVGLGQGNSDAEWLNHATLWSFGAKDTTEDATQVTINSPEGVAGATFIANMHLVDKCTPPTAVNWDDAGNNTAFLSGQSAMVFNVGTLVRAILTGDDEELKANMGVATLPAGPAGSFSPGILDCYGIFKTAKNPELAKEMIKWLMDDEWYSSWIETAAPAFVPVTEKASQAELWKDPFNAPFIESCKNHTYMGYPAPYSGAAGEVYNLRLYNTAIQEIIAGKDAQSAMDELAKKMQEIYDK